MRLPSSVTGVDVGSEDEDVAEEGDPRHSSLALVSDRASESISFVSLVGV